MDCKQVARLKWAVNKVIVAFLQTFSGRPMLDTTLPQQFMDVVREMKGELGDLFRMSVEHLRGLSSTGARTIALDMDVYLPFPEAKDLRITLLAYSTCGSPDPPDLRINFSIDKSKIFYMHHHDTSYTSHGEIHLAVALDCLSKPNHTDADRVLSYVDRSSLVFINDLLRELPVFSLYPPLRCWASVSWRQVESDRWVHLSYNFDDMLVLVEWVALSTCLL